MSQHTATGLRDAMTPDQRLRLISYLVFSSGLLPQSVCRFLPTVLPTIVSTRSNDAHERDVLCLDREEEKKGGLKKKKKRRGGGEGGVNTGG